MAGSRENTIRNVLIIGNNHVSSTILSALYRAKRYHLTVLTSRSATPYLSSSVPATSVTHLITTFSFPSLLANLKDQDLVISTQGGGDFDLQRRIINACVAAGVRRFVPAEFGQNSMNEAVQERLPPSKEKARVIAYLRGMQTAGDEDHDSAANGSRGHQHGDPNGEVKGGGTDCDCDCDCDCDPTVVVETSNGYDSPFEWAGIAVGCILDQKLISGDLGFDLKWQSATVHGAGSERFAVTSLSRVGELVALMAEHWERIRNRYLYAAGHVTTAGQIVGCLEKAMKKEWTVGYVETEQCTREGEQRIRMGFPDAGMFLMERSVLYDEKLGAVGVFEDRDLDGIFGLGPEKLDGLIERVVHDFERHGKADCGCG